MGLGRNIQPEDLTREQLCKLAHEVTKDSFRVYEENVLLLAENKRLKEFARPVIRQECWSIFPQDGGDIQELAEKLGLIEPRITTADDVDDESDYGVGDTFFVFSDVLKESENEVGL